MRSWPRKARRGRAPRSQHRSHGPVASKRSISSRKSRSARRSVTQTLGDLGLDAEEPDAIERRSVLKARAGAPKNAVGGVEVAEIGECVDEVSESQGDERRLALKVEEGERAGEDAGRGLRLASGDFGAAELDECTAGQVVLPLAKIERHGAAKVRPGFWETPQRKLERARQIEEPAGEAWRAGSLVSQSEGAVERRGGRAEVVGDAKRIGQLAPGAGSQVGPRLRGEELEPGAPGDEHGRPGEVLGGWSAGGGGHGLDEELTGGPERERRVKRPGPLARAD